MGNSNYVNNGEMWIECEKEYLISNHSTLDAVDIAKALGRTIGSVIVAARKMGLSVKNPQGGASRHWTKSEIKYLTESIGIADFFEMSAYLGRSVHSVRTKANRLDVREKGTSRRVSLSPTRRGWTTTEQKFLRENHGKLSTTEIAIALNRSSDAIYQQVFNLGLTKQRRAKHSRL